MKLVTKFLWIQKSFVLALIFETFSLEKKVLKQKV